MWLGFVKIGQQCASPKFRHPPDANAQARAADVRILAGNAHYEERIDRCAISKPRYVTADARQYEDYGVTDAPVAPHQL